MRGDLSAERYRSFVLQSVAEHHTGTTAGGTKGHVK